MFLCPCVRLSFSAEASPVVIPFLPLLSFSADAVSVDMPSFSFLRLADTAYPAPKGIVWRKIGHIQCQKELFVKGYVISSFKVNPLLKDTAYPGPKGIAGRKKRHFRERRGEKAGGRQAGRPLTPGEGCEKGNADEGDVEVPFVRVFYAVL